MGINRAGLGWVVVLGLLGGSGCSPFGGDSGDAWWVPGNFNPGGSASASGDAFSPDGPPGAHPPACMDEVRCVRANAQCGEIIDACGAKDCGACPPGQTCGGGGTANQCGAPPVENEAPVAPRWSQFTSCPAEGSSQIAALTSDRDGALYAAGYDPEGFLMKLSAAGEVTWTTNDAQAGCLFATRPSSYRVLEVSPVTGEVYAAGYCTTNGPCGSVLQVFSSDGLRCTTAKYGNDESGFGPIAFDERGGVLTSFHSSMTTSITYSTPSGATWTRSGRSNWTAPTGIDLGGGALDSAGNTYVIAQADGPTDYEGHRLAADGSSSVLLSFAPDGSLRGLKEFDGVIIRAGTPQLSPRDGRLYMVAWVEGALAIAGSESPTSFTGLALLSMTTDGQVIWARRLPHSRNLSFALDSSGDLAVYGTEGECGLRIQRYLSDGTLLWSEGRALSQCEGGTIFPADVAFSRGDVVISGSFKGTLDFGAGPASCEQTTRGFVVNLGR